MATEITMPKLSDTMTEGRLISWKKSVGERVERGEIIAEVETDKANMELEAFTSGVLLETRARAGEMVKVGAVIALVGAGGEAVSAAAAPPPPPVEPVMSAPFAAVAPERVMEELPSRPAPHPVEQAGESRATPQVRRLAREMGIDLSLVDGSGPEGRILREDLERFTGVSMSIAAKEEALSGAAEIAPPVVETGPLSRMRSAIARTTSESWRTIPHFYETMEIEMGGAAEIVRELKGSGNSVTYNDLVIKAAAMALGKLPLINSSFVDNQVVVNPEINIGIAVAVEDGLQVPVIKGCQGLSLKEIALHSLRSAERARSGSITQAEISGGTFSISNLGMFGIEAFAAVIMPPQGAILAVGSVADRPVVRDGQVVAAKTMKVTLSADHRLVDGAYAARFLGELKRILENPVLMLV